MPARRQWTRLFSLAALVATLLLLLLAPVLLVPETIRLKNLHIAVLPPLASRGEHFTALHAAGARIVGQGYPGIYLVGGDTEDLPARLRAHGTWLVLPPTLGLGCDYAAVDRIE